MSDDVETAPASPQLGGVVVSTRLRVVHIITGLRVGGAEQMLELLARHMDDSRFEHVVISLGAIGPIGLRLQRLGVPVVALGMRRRPADLLAFVNLVRVLRRSRPALVQTWLYHADLVGLLAAWLARVPRVFWTLRGSRLEAADRRRYRPMITVLAWLSRWPEAIIANSSAGIEYHVGLGYRPRRWVNIANGVDPLHCTAPPDAGPALRQRLGIPQDAQVIGHIARFHPMKDHAGFLRMAAILAVPGTTMHFLLAGRGVPAGVAELLMHHPELAGRVHCLDEIETTGQLLGAVDMLCSSSAYGEGFPNVVAEAMLAGVPVVATDVGDSRELLAGHGLVVPARDPAALAQACGRLLADRSLGASLAKAARQRVASFTPAGMAAAFEQLYAPGG